MSRMLVAYRACGCRTMALLDPEDAEARRDFISDAAAAGELVVEEDHDAIGAQPCDLHAVAPGPGR